MTRTTLLVSSADYAAFLAARTEHAAAMAEGPACVSPRNMMTTKQIVAVKNMATAAMRLLGTAEER